MIEFNGKGGLGGVYPCWVICSDVGFQSYLARFYHPHEGSNLKHVFCASLDKAIHFHSLGDLMEVMLTIPDHLAAYEEDPRFISGQNFQEIV